MFPMSTAPLTLVTPVPQRRRNVRGEGGRLKGEVIQAAMRILDRAPAAALSLRMGEGDLTRFLLRCAAASELWIGPGGWASPLRPRINRLVGLPADARIDHPAIP